MTDFRFRCVMKKETIICDKCHKEIEAKTSIYTTIVINQILEKERFDFCNDCLSEIFNKSTAHPTEKGGEGK